MTTARRCPHCQAELPPDSPQGVCPKCLFGLGLDDRYAPTDAAQTRFQPPKPHELAADFPQLEILDLIGCGGMGAVYKARQKGLNRLVALKILPPATANLPGFADRFSREARAMAMLSHPNIVAVYDSGKVGGYFYLLMEYVDGVNLREAMRSGDMTSQEALAVVGQICDALQFAHGQGVVHRDIKPENVLLDCQGRVKVVDFGLAKLVGNAPDNVALTQTMQVMGTPRYMAPEQMEGSREIDHRADLYSLGVVFYELLTGELPLGRFAPPSSKATIDARLDDVVLRTLEKEPQRRYQHASEIKTAVETITCSPYRRRSATGYEYRSSRAVFGVPLVHIATGFDPVTGRKRVARGIIAIGDIAIGLLAMGGTAMGGIALGGVAMGVIGLGGVSLGLLLALGGCAIGLGLSAGGLAVGWVAAGGAAVGIYAYGGGAFGVYPYGGNTQSAEALEFARESLKTVLQLPHWLAMIARNSMTWITIAAIVIAIVALAIRRRPVPTATMIQPPIPPKRVGHRSGSGCLIAVVVVLGGMLMLAFLAVALYFVSWTDTVVKVPLRQSLGRPDAFTTEPILEMPVSGWVMGPQGPEIAGFLAQRMELTLQAEQSVNELLQSIYQQYAKIEAEHTDYEQREEQRVVYTVGDFSQQLIELESQFWEQLETLLTSQQRVIARADLRLNPVNLQLQTADADVPLNLQALFPLGHQECRLEINMNGQIYQWTIYQGDTASNGRAVTPPPAIQRLWNLSQEE